MLRFKESLRHPQVLEMKSSYESKISAEAFIRQLLVMLLYWE